MAQQRGRFTNQYQHRHLRERLDAALRGKQREMREQAEPSKPVAIKKAELEIARLKKIVHAHDNAAYKVARTKADSLAKLHSRCIEKILFAAPDEALRLVKEFEAA